MQDEDDTIKDDFLPTDDGLSEDLFEPLDDDGLLDDDLGHTIKEDDDDEDFIDSIEKYG